MGKITKDELILANQLLEQQLIRRTKGYNILMEYWDCLPEEEKQKIDKRLKDLGI